MTPAQRDASRGARAVAQDPFVADELLLDRIRVGLWLLMAMTLAFVPIDFVRLGGTMPGVHLLQLELIVLCGAGEFYLRRNPVALHAKVIAVITVTGACAVSAAIGVLLRTSGTTPLLAISLVLACSTLLPWGVVPQSFAALGATAAVTLNAAVVRGDMSVMSSPQFSALIIVFVATIWISGAMDRQRRAQMLAEAQRRTSERRFQDLVETTSILPYEADLGTGRYTYIGPQARKLIGYSTEDWLRPGFLESRLHPDDRAWLLKTRDEFSQTASSFELEYRLIAEDGHTVWVQDRIAVEQQPDGSRYLRGFLIDVTARRRVERQRATLLEVARDLADLRDSRDLLQKIAELAAKALACDAVTVFAWSEPEERFRPVCQHGIPEALVDEVMALRFERRRIFGDRLSEGEIVCLNNVADSPDLAQGFLGLLDATRMLAVQMRSSRGDEGRLVAIRRGGPEFTTDDGALLEGLARLAASALERSRLLDNVRDDARVAAAIAELGRRLLSVSPATDVYRELATYGAWALGAAMAFVWLREETGVFVAAGQVGIPGEEWQSSAVLRVPEDPDHSERLLRDRVIVASGDEVSSLPHGRRAREGGVSRLVQIALEHGGQLRGVLACFYFEEPREWTAVNQRLAEGIAQMASLAIENTQLIEELEVANRVKSDFVATMSHELRTPLNVIIGYNELIRDEALGPITPEQGDALERVLAHSQSLLELINQTLDFGRLESGGVAIELSERSIIDLLDEIADETRELPQPNVLVRWEVADDLGVVQTDFGKLRVVTRNLLNNAFKFTAQGAVAVDARHLDGGVEIAVRDTGMGIPREAQAAIFEAFHQVDSSMTRPYGGVGLGLYIAKQLMDAIGGRISVESEVGVGSTFRLWIPERYRGSNPSVG